MTPTDTYKKLKCTDRYGGVSRSLVFKWFSRLSDGWTDSAQCGRRPYTNVGNVEATKEVTDGDRRKTVREVLKCTGISKSGVKFTSISCMSLKTNLFLFAIFICEFYIFISSFL